MDQDKAGPSCSDAGGNFHTVQPLRDLESNWAVDLARKLEDYLLKICSGEIRGEDGVHLSVNFAEAALLLQGSIQVYSRKVEYLHSLVLHALEFISQKSQHEQPEDTSAQPEDSAVHAATNEEDDPFWGLDDIPVEAKNSLDSASCRDAPLNYFVKPPANLVVLEGDCLDAIGDGGELESYLLATTELYRDFILLDSSDSAAVDAFLKGEDIVTKGKNGVSKSTSLPSKSCKSLQSPTRHSGGMGHNLSVGKSQDGNFNKSPCMDHDFEYNDRDNNSQSHACNIPDDNNNEFEMDGGFPEFRDDSDDDDDPWKPLNPYEPGNLKVKPFKKVTVNRRDGINCNNKRVPITAEFPIARLQGTISSELTQIWEEKHRAMDRQQELECPPLYEKLRQSLVLGAYQTSNEFINSKDDNDDNGYDSANPEFGQPDFDMPESTYMNEDVPMPPEMHDDGGAHFNTNDCGGQDPTHASLEDLCHSHLDSLLASIAETEKQTGLAARVSTWKQRIEQNLEEQDSRPPFDIHEYGDRVLEKLSLVADIENASMSFADVVKGQEKHDVARTFSALLQLVNNGNVDLQRLDTEDDQTTCYTAVNPFRIRLLRHGKRRKGVVLRSSKKRTKSPKTNGQGRVERDKSGKENVSPASSSPLRSTSCSMSPKTNRKFPLKLGKVGGLRCTPESKRRRKSRVEPPVDGAC